MKTAVRAILAAVIFVMIVLTLALYWLERRLA